MDRMVPHVLALEKPGEIYDKPEADDHSCYIVEEERYHLQVLERVDDDGGER